MRENPGYPLRISAENTASVWPPTINGKQNMGMDVNELKHLRELETENRRLKQMYAELSLDHKILKDIISKKL